MYEWSEHKRLLNLRKHGIDFLDAARVFDGIVFAFEDSRERYGEQRLVTLGLLETCVIAIVHAQSGESVRIISMRRATRHETEIYFSQIPD